MAGFFIGYLITIFTHSFPLFTSNIAVDANCIFICLKNFCAFLYLTAKTPFLPDKRRFYVKMGKIT
jgi:predicted CDP-diglyceride synthetase/phosphatidate cytidylyltransferase